jgi:hypothetical protein
MKAVLFPLALVLASSPALANVDCPAYVEPEVTITPIFGKPVFVYSVPMRQLKAMSVSADVPEAVRASRQSAQSRVGGLTEQRPVVSSEIVTQLYTLPNRESCAQIKKVNLTLAVKEIRVYIAREFPPGSCSHAKVVEHEMKHVGMMAGYLHNFPPVAMRHVRTFLDRIGMVRVPNDPNGEQAQRILSKEMSAYSSRFTAELTTAFHIMSERVDTPEEYRHVSESCMGETQRIFNASAN